MNRRRRPRRFRHALVIAWVASVVAVGLAILPNLGGRYDPNLAVLTATLLAVTWYTYFTYLAVNRVEPSWVTFDLLARSGGLYLGISNPTRRLLKIEPKIEVWIEGAHVDIPPIHGGRHGEAIRLGPQEDYLGSVDLGDHWPKYTPDNEGGGSYSDVKHGLFRARVLWTDDLGASDATYLKHWEWTIGNTNGPRLILAPSEINRLFPASSE